MEEESDGSIHSNLLVLGQAEQSDKTNIKQADSPIKRPLNKHDSFGNNELAPSTEYQKFETPKLEKSREYLDESSLELLSTTSTCNTKYKAWEFDWMSYLEYANKRRKTDKETNMQSMIEAAPNDLFLHVEASLDGGVREGMIVEIPYDVYQSGEDESNQRFWLAKVEAVYGPLLKLSYVGYRDEKKPVIWHDLTQKRLFPLGTTHLLIAIFQISYFSKNNAEFF